MDKEQALQAFWSSFGLEAYDENTVPIEATMPYITYAVVTDSLENKVSASASLWYKSTSWKDISNKKDEISNAIGIGGHVTPINGGYMWITRGTPFAQRMSDPNDDSIRRIYLNAVVEFLTEN